MNTKLELCLVRRYPKMLKDYNGPELETPLHYGLECGDGWYQLIWDLLGEIACINDSLVVVQIKQKYGALRFYYNLERKEHEDVIAKIVDKYERQAEYTCEVCGAPGKRKNLVVTCEKHKKS